MKTYLDYPQKDGIIAGFRSGDSEYLELIRQDLSLAMPLYVLSHLSSFFKIKAKYDPTVDLLVMLDIMWANAKDACKDQKKLFLYALESDSEEIYETFCDLEKNLTRMRPDTKEPFSFEEIFECAANLIDNEIPSSLDFGIKIAETDGTGALCPAYAESLGNTAMFSALGRSFALSRPARTKNIKNGEFFIIEPVYSGKEIDTEVLLAKFIKELGYTAISPYCRAAIIERNLIESVLSFTDNAEVTFPGTLREFATLGKGKLLVLCSKKYSEKLCYLAASAGLSALKVGKKQRKKDIRLISAKTGNAVSFKNELITNLLAFKSSEAVEAKIKKECSLPVSSLEKIVFPEGSNALAKNLSVSASSGDAQCSPYLCGIAQVVNAVAGEVANGASQDEIQISNILHGSEDRSALLSHILGLYRAQTELGIKDFCSTLTPCNDKMKSITFAFSGAEERTETSSKNAWLVIPEMPKNSVNFANIRKTFSFVDALLREDKNAMALPVSDIRADEVMKEYGHKVIDVPGGFFMLTDAYLAPCEGIKIEKLLKN